MFSLVIYFGRLPSPIFSKNLDHPSFIDQSTKMQKSSTHTSETFKLLLLGCQYGHTKVGNTNRKVTRCVKMFLLLTNKVQRKTNMSCYLVIIPEEV